MSSRSVKLVYVSGSNNLLLKAASYLMTIRMAFYYSKDFLRVKTRKPELANCISEEFKKLGLKVHVKIYED